jgi:hypothetical protein
MRTAIILLVVSSVFAAPPQKKTAKPIPLPGFIEWKVKDGTSAEDKKIVEALQESRKQTYDECRIQIESIDAEIKKLKTGASSKAKKEALSTKEQERSKFVLRLRGAATNPNYAVAKLNTAGSLAVGKVGVIEGKVEVIQVAGENEILVDTRALGGLVWIERIDAKKIVDGQELKVSSPLYFSGTKSYTSAIGSKRTVLLARPFDVSSFLEEEEEE